MGFTDEWGVVTINATTLIEAASGAHSLLHNSEGPNYALKKLTPGTNVAITNASGVPTINATNTNTATNLDNEGASIMYSLLGTGTAPAYTLKKLTPRTNVGITDESRVLTIPTTALMEAASNAHSLLHNSKGFKLRTQEAHTRNQRGHYQCIGATDHQCHRDNTVSTLTEAASGVHSLLHDTVQTTHSSSSHCGHYD